MLPARFPVAVVIERVALANRWASEQWRVAAVERDDSPRRPPVRMVHEGAQFAGASPACRWSSTSPRAKAITSTSPLQIQKFS